MNEETLTLRDLEVLDAELAAADGLMSADDYFAFRCEYDDWLAKMDRYGYNDRADFDRDWF